MKKGNIASWAEAVTREVYYTWRDRYRRVWPHGVAVFYSPVVQNPELMIISYQPGGNKEDFAREERRFKQGHFEVRDNEFVSANYAMATKVRRVFGFEGGLEALSHSVIFPLIFFRAPAVHVWRSGVHSKVRKRMEEFCFSKVQEIIRKLAPKKILVVGIKTYDALTQILDSVKKEKILYRRQGRNKRMVISATSGGTSLLAVPHLSGSRISRDDFEDIQSSLKKWLA